MCIRVQDFSLMHMQKCNCFKNVSLFHSVSLFLSLPGKICLVVEKEYMIQIIYLNYAIEVNIARIQMLKDVESLRAHCRNTFLGSVLLMMF